MSSVNIQKCMNECHMTPASNRGEARATFGHANEFFLFIHRIYKESISKEMNNDDLNLHSMTLLTGWLRYWFQSNAIYLHQNK